MSAQDLAKSPNTDFLIVTEFKNGVVLREKNNVILHEGIGVSQRNISKEQKVMP